MREKIDEKLKKQKDIYDPFQNIAELQFNNNNNNKN